jgi:hypothetical protein
MTKIPFFYHHAELIMRRKLRYLFTDKTWWKPNIIHRLICVVVYFLPHPITAWRLRKEIYKNFIKKEE